MYIIYLLITHIHGDIIKLLILVLMVIVFPISENF